MWPGTPPEAECVVLCIRFHEFTRMTWNWSPTGTELPGTSMMG
jgi:hypothetical protein